MSLKPESSVIIGLTTAAIVWSIHQNMTPPITDIRVASPLNEDVAGARKAATWTSLGVVSAISLIAKDATIFIIGGATVILADILTRHANIIDPETGRMAFPMMQGPALHEIPSEEIALNGA